MKNKTFILVIAAILLIGGIAAYFIFSNKSNTGTQLPASIVGGNEQKSASASASLKDLLNSGSPQQCTFADTSGNMSSEGTVYISNGKMRQDFSTIDNGQQIIGHMIADLQNFYTWTDGSTVGFKMAITASQETNQNTQGMDPNKKIDFKCGAWSPDSSLFDLPSSVQFNDINSMIPQTPPGQTQTPTSQTQTQTQPSTAPGNQTISPSPQEDKTTQCSACESLQGDARDACRQALGCY